MEQWDDRSRRLIGDNGCSKLHDLHVAVVGCGGVGGYAAEMLARTGVGHLTLIDADDVALSNVNRQIIALRSNVGVAKVELFAERFAQINPDLHVDARKEYLTAENVGLLIPENVDYVIDAIDTVAPKVALLCYCLEKGVKVISSMGAGGRLDVSRVQYCDLWSTRDDGLAKAVRNGMKHRNHREALLTVWSSEPVQSRPIELNNPNKRSSYGTLAPLPATFGIFLANHVIVDVLKSS